MAEDPGRRLATAGVGAPERRTRFGGAGSLELAALGTGLVLAALGMAALPDWIRQLLAFQCLFIVAFALYAGTLARLPRLAARPRAGAIVLIVAVMVRLALWATTPSLSDDVYRYVWEGRVLAHGGDPWARAPLDPALAPLRDARVFPRVNHPQLATIYPPLAEAGFALVAALSPTVAAMKLWVILHDIALIVLLMRGLGRERAAWAVVYAWNPLVWVEYAGSAHNDPTAMIWLAASLLALRRRPTLSALALCAGAMVKLAPLAVLPFLWRRWPPRPRALAAVLLAAGLGTFAWLTRGANSGLHAYWASWRNNALVFDLVERATGSARAARAVGFAALVAVVLVAIARGWGAVRGARATLKAGLLVSPVAHPWYQGWYLMLEPFAPSAPWILLSGTAILSYGVLAAPPEGLNFHLPLAWRAVEYGVPAALAAVAGSRSRGAARDGSTPGEDDTDV
ncbi:MAG TPA: glycosyltransferase 87 family protein [Candidatus Eisenbacteria bacterium]